MIVVENGAAVALTQFKWLEFLECRATGASTSVVNYGYAVGDVVGDVARIGDVADSVRDDPYRAPDDSIIVTQDGRAVELTPDQWLAYLAASLASAHEPLADYGSDLGTVLEVHELLTGASAAILATGVRAALVARGELDPSPVPAPAPLRAVA